MMGHHIPPAMFWPMRPQCKNVCLYLAATAQVQQAQLKLIREIHGKSGQSGIEVLAQLCLLTDV